MIAQKLKNVPQKPGVYFLKNEAGRKREAISERMIGKWGGEEEFISKRRDYTNKRLEEILMNKGQFAVTSKSRLIRKATPIYQIPESVTGRAQFFAPVKSMGTLSFDTYWFNMAVIWISTLVFYLTLVYDLLRKFTNWNQVRKLRQK